jgi:sn-glycerol 3-phosphate transport system ATP-binding protein
MLGVRPEHIELAFERGLAAAVQGVEYLGADSLVTCRIGEATVAVRAPGAVGLARGDPAWLAWAPSAQHVFDRNGRRVAAPAHGQSATMLA